MARAMRDGTPYREVGPDEAPDGLPPPSVLLARARRPRSSPVLRVMVGVFVLLALIPVVLTLVYAVVPPVSTLMLWRWASQQPVTRQWVPLEQMGDALPRSVVASEDAFFCRHHGVDWGALREAMTMPGGPSRGASTIPMQAARNLFLWQGFGYVRKPLEIALALWLDLVLSKARILEIYLNIVEWGPNGQFGAQAASQLDFRRDVNRLTARQAALLAATLPNPKLRNPARPNGAMLGLAAGIEGRVRHMQPLFDCLP
jgi:monofunctional glycosyltransferase